MAEPTETPAPAAAATGSRWRQLVTAFPALRRLAPPGRQRIPVVRQSAETDCGAACLTMVLAYHGKNLRLEEVRELLGIGRDGVDALSLVKAARFFGLRARGVKIEEIENLSYLAPGSVLHWGFQHYVVFEGIDRRGARVIDPGMGRRWVPLEDLRRSFTGIALVFEKAEDFLPTEARPRGPFRYFSEVLAHSELLSRIVVLSFLLRLLALAVPLLTGLLVDRIVPRGDTELLTVLGVGLIGLVFFDFVSSLVRSHLMLHLRTHLDAKITLEFLEHLFALPYSFFSQRSAGDLMMRLNSNTTIREILTSGALTGILDGALACLYLVLLFFVHSWLATLVLVLGLLRLTLFLLVRRRQTELMSQTLQVQAKSRNYQVQMLSGIETLKALGVEQQAIDQWSNLFTDELNVSLARGRLDALFEAAQNALTTASPLIVLCLGATEVMQGQLSLGTLLAINALAVGFLTPLSSLVSTAVQLQLLGSYLERIEDVTDSRREQEEKGAPAPQLTGHIRLEDVSFRYSPMRPMVVRGVSVEIAPGSFVALVGSSGAGKSTLAMLLLGLYEPTSGKVYYDGVELSRLDLRSVRRQLGIVLQHPYLFAESIRRNIGLGDENLPLHRIVEAAKKAHIHEAIRALPMGYDTPLADGGLSMSGGQRQRLALARALVRRPSILLLDEATSHLDAETEQVVQQELERLRATRIVIAHRLSTVVRADLILVMEDGQIVEQGRHAQLLERGGRYAELVRAQLAPEGEAG